MRHSTLKYLAAACAALGLAACKDNVSPSPVSDTQMASDVAASAGDAAVSALTYMAGNEGSGGLPSSEPSFSLFGSPPVSENVTFSRVVTCLDANGAVVTGCSPLTSVRKVVVHVSVDGSRQGTYFTGGVHRVLDDTTTRVRNVANTADSLRVHSGVGASHDTTTFQDSVASGFHYENASDSINAVTFRIPRSTYPFPISGSLVRNVSVHASYTKNGTTVTRDFVKRVEVDFPADAQGNVVLKFDAKTCNLNLVTHAVSGCH